MDDTDTDVAADAAAAANGDGGVGGCAGAADAGRAGGDCTGPAVAGCRGAGRARRGRGSTSWAYVRHRRATVRNWWRTCATSRDLCMSTNGINVVVRAEGTGLRCISRSYVFQICICVFPVAHT